MSSRQSQQVAKVTLMKTYDKCKIETIYGQPKEILVHISDECIRSRNQSYRMMLGEFVSLLEFHEIIDVSNQVEIPNNIVQTFICICQQLDRGIPKINIVDEMGNPVYSTVVGPTMVRRNVRQHEEISTESTSRPQIEPTAVSAASTGQSSASVQTPANRLPSQAVMAPFQRAIGDVMRTLATGQVDRNQWQTLVGNLGSSLVALGAENTALSSQTGNGTLASEISTNVNYAPSSPFLDTANTSTNLTSSTTTDYIQPNVSQRMSSLSESTFSTMPVNRSTNMTHDRLPPAVPPLPNTMELLMMVGQMSNILANRRNGVNALASQSNANTLPLLRRPELLPTMPDNNASIRRNLTNPQPMPSLVVTDMETKTRDLSYPSQQIQSVQASSSSPQNTNITNDMDDTKSEDVNQANPPPRFVENRQGATREIAMLPETTNQQSIDEVKADIADHLAVIQRTTSQRTAVSSDTIFRLAAKINELIISGKSKHPNFANKSKSGYQRIKNYIHNLTRVWLSRDEIDSFVEEISKINPELVISTSSD